jgi:hypothetical protein
MKKFNQKLRQLKAKLTKMPLMWAGIFGDIKAPVGVQQYNASGNIGLILFASNVLKIFTIAMGIFLLFNFVKAGFDFVLHPDDTGMQTKVKDQLTMNVIGLVIIAAAYTIAGLIGLLFFNDVGFILNPKLTGPAIIIK